MSQEQYKHAAAHLLTKTNVRPQVGIICGSGLSMLSESIVDPEVFEYADIPGFPEVTVQGHQGQLIFGTMDGIEVVCMKGRFHYYEGHDMSTVVLPVRVMRLLGVKMLIVTNAAGGLKEGLNVGDICVIQDHFAISMVAGNNPLRGPNDPALGDRFPPVSDAYDSTLQSIAMSIGESIGLSDILHPDGVYCMAAGPSYESKAECRFLAGIGGHTVGMSTIPEVIAARHCGMKVLCLSFVTNKVVTGMEQYEVVAASHAEVMESVEKGGKNIEQLVRQFVSKARIGEYLHSTKPAPVFDHVAYLKTAPKPKAKGPSGSVECSNCDLTMHIVGTVAITAVAMFAGFMIAKRK